MVRVDVFDLEWRQLLRQLGTHHVWPQRPNAKRREAPRSHSKGRKICQRLCRSEASRAAARIRFSSESGWKYRVSFQNERSARLRSLGETRLPLQQITCVRSGRNSQFIHHIKVRAEKEIRWRYRRSYSCNQLLGRAQHPGNREHQSNHKLVCHVDEEGVKQINAQQNRPDLAQGSDARALPGPAVPRKRKRLKNRTP